MGITLHAPHYFHTDEIDTTHNQHGRYQHWIKFSRFWDVQVSQNVFRDGSREHTVVGYKIGRI